MVVVQYEGAVRADPDNQKMKVKIFFHAYAWIGPALHASIC